MYMTSHCRCKYEDDDDDDYMHVAKESVSLLQLYQSVKFIISVAHCRLDVTKKNSRLSNRVHLTITTSNYLRH